jgi:segregation and condensation protein B
MELKTIVESLIFASDKPLTLKQLKALTGNTKAELIKTALDDIQAEFQSSGIQLAEVGGGYQFRTHPDAAPWVKRLLAGRPPRLTQAMLETLAIIAYRQPITRPEIEDIRGVDCGGVIRLLLERSLCRIVGKKEEPGRPILYGTTRQFLEFFNLKDLSALPTLKEFTELSEEMAGELEAFDEGSERPQDGEAGEAAPLGPPAEAVPLDAAPPDAAPEPAAPEPAAPLDAAPEPGPEVAPESEVAPEPAGAPLDAAPEPAAPLDAAPEPEPAPGPEAPPPGPTATAEDAAGPQTWARAGAAATVAHGEEEEEDAALVALDRAMEQVQGVLRAHQQAERARLKTLLADGAPEPAFPEAPEPPEPPASDDLPGSSASDDRPPEEL